MKKNFWFNDTTNRVGDLCPVTLKTDRGVQPMSPDVPILCPPRFATLAPTRKQLVIQRESLYVDCGKSRIPPTDLSARADPKGVDVTRPRRSIDGLARNR